MDCCFPAAAACFAFSAFGDAGVRGVDVVFEQLVLAEGGSAHSAFVGQMGWLQCLAVVLRHVIKQLPLVNLSTDRAPARVLSFVSCVLHGCCDQPMASQ